MNFTFNFKGKIFPLFSLLLLLLLSACQKDNTFREEIDLPVTTQKLTIPPPNSLNLIPAEGMNILIWSAAEKATEYRILVEQDGVELEYITGKNIMALPNNIKKGHIKIQTMMDDKVSTFFRLRPEEIEEEDCSQTHWEYEGDAGPANWAHLCSGFSDCGGNVQSPIDITGAQLNPALRLAELLPSYNLTETDIINNGHTVQFNYNTEGYLNVNGKDYQLLQFHFHADSEHTVDGKRFPLEVHLVHKSRKGDLAVVGILFEEGDPNFFLAKFFPNLPEKEGDEVQSDLVFDVTELFPDSKDYLTYQGSLTTPPCSEIVTWMIMKEPLHASKEQLSFFSEILNENYRPTRALNGRTISAYAN